MWPFSKPGAETHRNPPPSSSNTPPSSLAPGPSAPKSSSQTGSQASSPQQTNSTGRLSSTGLTTASGMYPNSTIEVGDSGVTVEYVDSESGLPLGSRQLSQTEAAVANKLHNVREAIGNNRMLEAFQHLIDAVRSAHPEEGEAAMLQYMERARAQTSNDCKQENRNTTTNSTNDDETYNFETTLRAFARLNYYDLENKHKYARHSREESKGKGTVNTTTTETKNMSHARIDNDSDTEDNYNWDNHTSDSAANTENNSASNYNNELLMEVFGPGSTRYHQTAMIGAVRNYGSSQTTNTGDTSCHNNEEATSQPNMTSLDQDQTQSKSILEEQGLASLLDDAAQSADSVVCPMCNGVVSRKRWDDHATLWCDALED